MSLKAESPNEYSRPPPPLSFSPTMDESRSFQSLPPMSALLRHEHGGAHEAQGPFLARQFQAPFNMVKQPLWHSSMDLNASAQRAYHASEPHMNSHFSQGPSDSVLSFQNTQHHTLTIPSYRSTGQQRRIEKKITQRREPSNSKEQTQSRSSSSESPLRYLEQPHGLPEVNFKNPYERQDPAAPAGPSRSMAPGQGRSMPISGLLSDAPSQPTEPRYVLRMRQQPIAARACGFGERDRRVIDPPPILQMLVEDPSKSAEEIRDLVRQPWAVVHCVLWDPIADKDDTAMPGTTDKRQQRRLMGTLVSSPFVGNDEHGVEGCFFAFPDLSVRTPGTYSLKFSLVLLDPARMFIGSREKVKSVVLSSTFHVYNAKDFCGMRASSALTKSLKLQGCLISVKKGNAGKNNRQRDEADEEEEEEEEDDDGPQSSSSKRGKRAKR